jgi:hypothetical protein
LKRWNSFYALLLTLNGKAEMNFILALIALVVVAIVLRALFHKKSDKDHEKYLPSISSGKLKMNKPRNPYSF